MSGDRVEQDSNKDPKQNDLLWQYVMHEDVIFNERLNFFLVFESVLLGAIAMLFNKEISRYRLLMAVLVILGLLLTVVWAYVQAKQRSILKIVTRRLMENLPEYRETVEELEEARWRRLSATALLAYVIPGLIGLMWGGLLILVWF